MPAVFSFDGIGAGDRAEFWRDACSRTTVGVNVQPEHGQPIEGSVRANTIADLVVGEIAAPGQLMTRTRQLIDHADEQYLLLGIQAGGHTHIGQGQRRGQLNPGDCAVFESHQPFQLNFPTSFDIWVFAFPRHSLPLGQRVRQRLAAQPIQARTGLAGVAARALLDLGRHANQLAGQPAEPARRLANDLLLTLLNAPLSEHRQLDGALRRTLPLRIKDYINQRLTDPTLTPTSIAAAFGISTRYLHRLFTSEPQTVGQYIRRRRLERCRLRLIDPHYANRTISTLAFDAGFGDLSGFNRAFKTTYGVSPGELRNQATSDLSSTTSGRRNL